MEIGIFAKTFVRPTLGETLDAVKIAGMDCVQLNMACAGLSSMPDEITPQCAAEIKHAHKSRAILIAAVSGTFNMIHPDSIELAEGMRRLAVLAAACRHLGTKVITLCTGTKDPENMWRRHPANDSAQSWKELRHSMSQALEIAERHDVILGVEPEVANVIDSAAKARRLLDEMKSPRLKIVMDGANLFHRGELAQMDEILKESVDLLGRDLILAHAKDLDHDGEAGNKAAGTGVLNYDLYLQLLQEARYKGPLILHGLEESEVPFSVNFLSGKLASLK